MRTNQPATPHEQRYRRGLFIAVITAIIGGIIVALTIALSHESYLSALAHERNRIVAAEISLFTIIVVEMAGRAILHLFRNRGALQAGIAIRAVLRAVSYLVLSIAVISLLASNSALAIGIGSFTGLVIGFAFQNTLSNIFAGMFLAISRPFQVGDEISILGNRGKVVEIGLMYTLIDSGDQWVVIPSSVLMTNALGRKKEEITEATDQKNTLKSGPPGEKETDIDADSGQNMARQEKEGKSWDRE